MINEEKYIKFLKQIISCINHGDLEKIQKEVKNKNCMSTN